MAAAVKKGLFLAVPLGGDGEAYRPEPGRTLSVIKHGGKLWGIDDERPDEDPVPLSRADLMKYRLSLDAVAERLRDANELEGEPCQISARLHYVGCIERAGTVNAVLLALFSQQTQAVASALSVPTSVSGRHERYVLICPSFEVTDQNSVRRLEDAGILLTQMNPPDLWRVVWPALGGPSQGTGRELLTVSEDGAYCVFGGQRVKLSSIQGALLVALTRHAGKPLARDALGRVGWGKHGTSPDNLRAMMKRLRDKLEQAAEGACASGIRAPEKPIETQRGGEHFSGTYTLVLSPSQVEVMQAPEA